MKGSNTLKICQAQMIKALDLWLKDYVMSDNNFDVVSVKPIQDLHFEVALKGKEDDN